jgi:hypothetical protein
LPLNAFTSWTYDMAILNSLPQFLDALFCGLILGWRGFQS